MKTIEIQDLSEDIADMLSNASIGTGFDRYGRYNSKESKHGTLVLIDVTCGQGQLNEDPFNVFELSQGVAEDDIEALGAYEKIGKLRDKNLIALGCHRHPVIALNTAIGEFVEKRKVYEQLLNKRNEVYADVSPLCWISVDDEMPVLEYEDTDIDEVFEVILSDNSLVQACLRRTGGSQDLSFVAVKVTVVDGRWKAVEQPNTINARYWRKLPYPPQPKRSYGF